MKKLFGALCASGLAWILAAAAGATPFSLSSSVTFSGGGFNVTLNPISLIQYNALDRTYAGDAICLETVPNGGCNTAALDTLDVLYVSVTVNSGAVSQLGISSGTFPFGLNAVEGAGYIAGSDPNPGWADIPGAGVLPVFRLASASDVNWISATDTSDVLWVAYDPGVLSAGETVNFMVKASGQGAVNDTTGIAAEIPEPTTALLLGTGLLGLWVASRKRAC